MSAYYNEWEPYPAQWLRNLIKARLIAPGDVDERSIKDVQADDLKNYTQCHFFAGIGGWSLALRLALWPDTRPVWTGSCPCQPFSAAGKRQGFDDERHLWPQFRRLIAERHPAIVFGEQVASATEWIRLVRGDLEAVGYAVGIMPVEAASAGADHLRDRFWFVGHAQGIAQREPDNEANAIAISGQARCLSRSPSGISMVNTESPGPERNTGKIFETNGGSDTKQSRKSIGAGIGGGLADANDLERRIGNQQCARQQPQHDQDQGASPRGVANTSSGRRGRTEARKNQQSWRTEIERTSCVDWVTGADGKARRVKSGIRLLAHGIPQRVAKLRAFGNAIDPRPAAEFIKAFEACQP